jgi:DNA mismatch endonuclease (patch repair protein)
MRVDLAREAMGRRRSRSSAAWGRDDPEQPTPAVAQRMSAVRTRDTTPELLLRRALFASGLRYRLHDRRLPGCPDIVLVSKRVAVFVDGDFWHGRSWRSRGFASLDEQFARWHNGRWWLRKIRENIARDRRQTRRLQRMGWRVVRIRDSEITRDLNTCVVRLRRTVGL